MKDKVAQLFSPGIELAVGSVPEGGEGDYAVLFDEEKDQLARSVDKRRREFAAGRVLAREALARFGVPHAPLLNDEDRAPHWPSGVVGSITHTQGFCAVVVARNESHRGLGIDAEPAAPLRERLFGHICTDVERESLAEGPLDSAGLNARLIFCAKEAFYKCQYAVTQTYLGFHDVDVSLSESTFSVKLRKDVPPLFEVGDRLEGRFVLFDDLVVTACELPNEG